MGLRFRNSKSNFLSVSGILLLFCFQQFILYFSIYYLKKVNVVLYTLIIDIPLGIYIFFGLLIRSLVTSVRYSILWCIYSITLIIKMSILIFMDKFKRYTTLDGLSSDCNEMILSFFGLYVTPLVFSLFNNASKSSLFHDKSHVTIDELLHSDLGLSTTIDLWDLILMFSHLIKYYKAEVKEGKRLIFRAKLFVIFITFVLVTIFLLGLVIPTVDGDYIVEDRFKTNIFNEGVRLIIKFVRMLNRNKSYELKRNSEALKNTTHLKSVSEGSSSLDMYTMAKFTFIIGFFLIDMPFLCYRLYILVKYNVFSLLMYKNFIFLFLRPYRLNMSQLAERDTAKGVQAAFLNTDILNANKDKKGNAIHFNTFEESDSDNESQLLRKYSRKGSVIRKRRSRLFKSAFVPKLLSKLSFTQPRPFTKSDPLHISSKLFNIPFNRDFMLNGFHMRSSLESSNSDSTSRDGSLGLGSRDNLGMLDSDLDHLDLHEYKMRILKILKRGKVLPIKSFPLSVILRNWYHFLFSKVRNFESTFAINVGNFTERKFNQIAFLITILFTVMPRVLLVLIYYLLEVRSPRDIVSNLTNDASFMEKFMFQICFAFSFTVFIMFLYSCKVFDSIFSFARDLLNLYSMMVCLHSFKSMVREHHLSWLLFLFLLYPASATLSFLNNVTPFTLTTDIPFKTIASDDSISTLLESIDSNEFTNNADGKAKSSESAETTDNRPTGESAHPVMGFPYQFLANNARILDNNPRRSNADSKVNTAGNFMNHITSRNSNNTNAATAVRGNSSRDTDSNTNTAKNNTNPVGNNGVNADANKGLDGGPDKVAEGEDVNRLSGGDDGGKLMFEHNPAYSEKISKIKLLNLKLIYVLLKYSIGPVTLNHRLCSMDMIEMFKIHDSLLYSQWSQFFYSLFFRILCCFNLDSKSSTLVLILDLVFLFLYNAMSQSVRSLMFRKHEVNFIIMRLLGILRYDWDDRDLKSETSVTFADVDKYIKVQGLFSSPGIVIPPFA